MKTIWNRSGKRQVILATAAALLSMPLLSANVAVAAAHTLDRIDFLSRRGGTDITLHTAGVVPVKEVLVSTSKVILEVDKVSAARTIKTNFSGAVNVSHVVIQPLSGEKVRLIIRGQGLGEPNVLFEKPVAETYLDNIRTMADSVDEDLNINTAPDSGVPADDEAWLSESEQAMADLEEQSINHAVYRPDKGTNPDELVLPAVDIGEPLPVTGEGDLSGETGAALLPDAGADIGGALAFFGPAADWLKRVNWPETLKYLLLASLLSGLAVFIRKRIQDFRSANTDFQDLLDEQAHGRRIGFREMASAYRRDRGAQASVAKKPGKTAGSLIGLSALMADDTATEESPVRPQPELPRAVNQSRRSQVKQGRQSQQAVRNATPPPTPSAPARKPAPRQAISQYKKQQEAPAKPATVRKRKVGDDMLRQELARAQEIQQRAEQRRPASRPQPLNPQKRPASNPKANANNGSPLPENPNVLDFLRNVADLMEQDGEATLAKSIQRNLNPST